MSEVCLRCELRQATSFQRASLSAPKKVPPASTVLRFGNEGTYSGVRPDRKNHCIDRQTDVMDQDEESEDRHPGEVQHETGREREEEAEPKRMGKYEGGGRLRNIGDPGLPSRKEVEELFRTQVPYRNSCLRGKDLDHSKALEEDRRSRGFSFDYFSGRREECKDHGACRTRKSYWHDYAIVVLLEGTSGPFAAMKVPEFVKECRGCGD